MSFGVTPRESLFSRWWVRASLSKRSSDRNVQVLGCAVATKENTVVLVTACCKYCLLYAPCLMRTSVAMGFWPGVGARNLIPSGCSGYISRGGCLGLDSCSSEVFSLCRIAYTIEPFPFLLHD